MTVTTEPPVLIGHAFPGDTLLCIACAKGETGPRTPVSTRDLPNGEWCDRCKTALVPA